MQFQVENISKETNLPSGHVENEMKALLIRNTWANFLDTVPEKPDKSTWEVTYYSFWKAFASKPSLRKWLHHMMWVVITNQLATPTNLTSRFHLHVKWEVRKRSDNLDILTCLYYYSLASSYQLAEYSLSPISKALSNAINSSGIATR